MRHSAGGRSMKQKRSPGRETGAGQKSSWGRQIKAISTETDVGQKVNDAPPISADAETHHLSWRDVLPVHRAADLFPMMTLAELVALGNDIKAAGLKMPVVIWTP